MLHKFEAAVRYPVGEGGDWVVRLDPPTGNLQVELGGQLKGEFALCDAEGRPQPLALRVEETDAGAVLELGQVTYDREGLHVEWFEVNDPDVRIAFEGSQPAAHLGILDIKDIDRVGTQMLAPEADATRIAQGHLGILDIRDIARKYNVVFLFDIMPLILSLEGNRLAVKTLAYMEGDPFGPWYFNS